MVSALALLARASSCKHRAPVPVAYLHLFLHKETAQRRGLGGKAGARKSYLAKRSPSSQQRAFKETQHLKMVLSSLCIHGLTSGVTRCRGSLRGYTCPFVFRWYLAGGFIVLLQQNHNSPYKACGETAAAGPLPLGQPAHLGQVNLPAEAQKLRDEVYLYSVNPSREESPPQPS